MGGRTRVGDSSYAAQAARNTSACLGSRELGEPIQHVDWGLPHGVTLLRRPQHLSTSTVSAGATLSSKGDNASSNAQARPRVSTNHCRLLLAARYHTTLSTVIKDKCEGLQRASRSVRPRPLALLVFMISRQYTSLPPSRLLQ